ncbi:MAG: hypothetical protein VR75_08430 [Hyphomonadaceae bacterium BRH_c29]|nr:MAG: hypothetical protein VR75_08430 [Hyphomonadaceae bacterium BRH_c29]
MKLRLTLACVGMLVSASALAACSGGGSADAPAIEPFLWTESPAYCAFLPSGTKFNPADKSTWEFTFITEPQAGTPLAQSQAVMKIAGEMVRLNRAPDAPGANARTWVYRGEDGMLEVELKLDQAATEIGGSTGGPQNAKLSLRAPSKGLVQEVRGGCGL